MSAVRDPEASSVVIDRGTKHEHRVGLVPRLDRLGSVAPLILLGTALILLVVVANGEKQGAVFTLVLPQDRGAAATSGASANGSGTANGRLHISSDATHGW